MACTVGMLRKQLECLDDDDVIAIDEGGLNIVVVGESGVFFEMGGVPLEDEEETDGKADQNERVGC